MSQLFDALDPSPFHEKDLDHHVEGYIVESIRELPGSACWLVILLDQPTGIEDERVIRDAIRIHFERRSTVLRRQLRQLLRRGFISLGIGIAFLAVFFLISRLVHHVMGESGLATLFREGLLIVGWVAMWRPLEIFLYDWWPIVGERRLYDRLSKIPIRVIPSDSRMSPSLYDEARALARWEGEGGRVLMPDQPADARLQPQVTAADDVSNQDGIYVARLSRRADPWAAGMLPPNEGGAV
jgi:hypothetical protein